MSIRAHVGNLLLARMLAPRASRSGPLFNECLQLKTHLQSVMKTTVRMCIMVVLLATRVRGVGGRLEQGTRARGHVAGVGEGRPKTGGDMA